MTKQEYRDMYDVVGAAMEVYNTLGRGMAEAIYQEALAVEMKKRSMNFEREKELTLVKLASIRNVISIFQILMISSF